MANEISLFAEGMNTLPAHLQGVGVDEETRKLAGGGGGLRISIKGGVWRLINNGEEIMKNEQRAMNFVVVKSSPDTSRTFYEGKFVEGENNPPVCWSSNGKEPDAGVPKRQAPNCTTCRQNVAGSGENESRACRYSRNLAVVLPDDIGGKVFKMSLPAQSIFGKVENNVAPLQAYGKQLVTHNAPISSVVTEMKFDTNSATPKIGFRAVRFLTPEEYAVAKKQGESPEALEAIAISVVDNGGAKDSSLMPPTGTSPVAPAAAPEPAPVKPAKVKKDKAPEPAAAAFAFDMASLANLSPEEMMAKMAQFMAAQQAAAGQVANAGPVVVEKAAPTAATSASAAAILSNWENDAEV